MAEHLELHVITADIPFGKELQLKLLGEQFFPAELTRDFGEWTPYYRRIPKFGGDLTEFEAGPYESPGDYSEIVVALGSVLEKVPRLARLLIYPEHVSPFFWGDKIEIVGQDEMQPIYEGIGGLLVDSVAESVSDATGRHVEIAGDPHAFQVMDLANDMRNRELGY